VQTETSAVELADEDPDVFEHFLEFLYMGMHRDDVTSGAGKPADVSMLDPSEVARLPGRSPGVHIRGEPDEEALEGMWGNEYNPVMEDIEDMIAEEFETEDGDGYDDDHSATDRGFSGSDMEQSVDGEWNVDGETQGLFLPLCLYVMAHKFSVPALQLLARGRFYRAAELTWREAACFPAVVDELYRTVPTNEVVMREMVCRLVGSGIREDRQRLRMSRVMEKHGEFTLGVMNYMIDQEKMIW
jgi:hypothetical protein